MTHLPEKPFVLIRHGQTDANRDGLIAGRLEAQLTELGRSAACGLRDWRWPAALRLFCSPQDRARQTAALAFPGHVAQPVAALRERDWGHFEGRPVAEQPPRFSTPEGGESWADLLARIHAGLTHCLTEAGGDLPVLVAHSGVIRAARALGGGDPGGPSPANATPLVFRPLGGGVFSERPLTCGEEL